MYTALKAKIPFLDINQERDFGYEGYTGMVELARQLTLTIESPVWEAVRRPAPWTASPQTEKSLMQRREDAKDAKDAKNYVG
jgi:nitrogenase molybdenum-cofactor synthesis protein NifE